MFFDRKIQIKKLQLTRDLKNDAILYPGIRLPCSKDITTLSKDIATSPLVHVQPLFDFLKTHAPHFKCLKLKPELSVFKKIYSFKSILLDQLHSDRYRSDPSPYKNMQGIEIISTRFRTYHETELVCKYPTSF